MIRCAAVSAAVSADRASPSSLNCMLPLRAASERDAMVSDPRSAACITFERSLSLGMSVDDDGDCAASSLDENREEDWAV